MTLLDDSAVTARVKTAFAVGPDHKGLAINADTLDNVVTMSGTVTSEGMRRQAETTAQRVDGVRDVKNDLMAPQQSYRAMNAASWLTFGSSVDLPNSGRHLCVDALCVVEGEVVGWKDEFGERRRVLQTHVAGVDWQCPTHFSFEAA